MLPNIKAPIGRQKNPIAKILNILSKSWLPKVAGKKTLLKSGAYITNKP
jgi:hypothetical protein